MSAADRRILIVKLADLGDLLLCEPAIRSLRTAFPAARIDLLVPPATAPLAHLLGHDLSVLTFPKSLFDNLTALARPNRFAQAVRFGLQLRRAHYDTVVVLHHLTTPGGATKQRWLARATSAANVVGLDNGRGNFLTARVIDLGFGAKHEATYMLDVARAAGGAPVDPAPQVDRASVQRGPALPADYAVIYPATGPYSSARTWPVERYGAVASALAADGLTPVVVGSRGEAQLGAHIRNAVPSTIDLMGATSLPELAGVVTGARIVVGGDSFVGHLAAALDVPRVTIFGPSNRDAWRPWGSVDVDNVDIDSTFNGAVVYHDLPCQPCLYAGYRLGRPEGCPTRTCLDRVAVADVLQAIDRILKAS